MAESRTLRMAAEFTFVCPLAAGLHARPASLLAELAGALNCEVSLTNLRTGVSANLKSTLGIIAADVRAGDEFHLRSDFLLNLKDYEIGGLSRMLGLLKMQEDIGVHVDLVFGPP